MNRIKTMIAVFVAFALCFALISCGDSKDSSKTEKDTVSPGKDTAASNNTDKSNPSIPDKKDNEKMNLEDICNEKFKEYANDQYPIGVIVMEDGSAIVMELYSDIADNTVRNFISLANTGFYDGVIFHRVIDKFMIQTGDPQGTGYGGPGYRIRGEFSNNGHNNPLRHTPGVVSMARQGNQYNPKSAYDTGGSQFFICVADCPSLDGDYAAFGKVIDGMDMVYAISRTVTDSNDRPIKEQKMAYVRVDTHGVEYAAPDTIPER